MERKLMQRNQIANFADKLASEPSGRNLVIFIIIFTTAWLVQESYYVQC